VTEVNYAVVLVNTTEFAERNGVLYYGARLKQYYVVSILKFQFSDMDANFDISSDNFASSSDGFNERCIIGLRGSQIPTGTYTKSYINIKTVAITFSEQLTSSFFARFDVLCYKKLYYNAECTTFFNFTYCGTCNRSACISCPAGMAFSTPNVCNCSAGSTQVNSSCVQEGCMIYVPAYGTPNCTACNASMYNSTSTNNSCQCSFVLDGVCTLLLTGAQCTAIGYDHCVNCIASPAWLAS
jgi:hypothetical protein